MVSYLIKYIIILINITYSIKADVYKEKLSNYSVYEVTAFNSRERAVLFMLYTKVDDIVFINGITNEASMPMDVLVDNCCTDEFESIMQSNDIEYVKVAEEHIKNQLNDIKGPLNYDLKGHLYHDLGENIEPKVTKEFLCYAAFKKWVQQKIKKYNILEKVIIGQTYEKRDIFVLKISTGKKNKAIFLMGGEEGRDWTSSAILLNFVEQILERKIHMEFLISQYDFYILPILNPDGYMYSMMKNRIWSKNCRMYFPKTPCHDNTSAIGINIDRNWFFDKTTVQNEECDPVFIGLKPLSEEETIAVSNFLNIIAMNMMAFINIRGFENLITIPYGYENKYCNNFDILEDVASAVHDAVVKQHNTSFYYGVTSKYLYNFSGNVADWVKKQLNTPIVYTFYMKVESFILPSINDVQPLTAKLSTMIKEILLLANTLYGPLFNIQFKHSVNIFVFIVNLSCFITKMLHMS